MSGGMTFRKNSSFEAGGWIVPVTPRLPAPTTKHTTPSVISSGIMTPEDFFHHVFEFLPRQGPGCTGATQKAFSFLPALPKDAKVLDIGCGSGAQTRDLAELTTGTITAVDIYQPFLDFITARDGYGNLSAPIRTVCAPMDNLPFADGEFDLIWSEGAIFIIGFAKGLRAWKRFVKEGGFIVVSDAAWFEPDPPLELVDWWAGLGDVPATEDQLREQVKEAGLRLMATYRLPEAGWRDNYYVPMEARIAELRKSHGADPAHAAVLDAFEKEIEMYRQYSRYYGYTFFVMQNP